MACLYPTPRTVRKKDGTKVPVVSECGYCINCRIQKKISEAVRMMHESVYSEKNCFITLTYGLTPEKEKELSDYNYSEDSGEEEAFRLINDTLPKNGSLKKEDLTKFIKRLRKQDYKFKYFACGEYGDKMERAHYHACIFGEDFPLKCKNKKEKCISVNKCKDLDCEYKKLYEIWGLGYISVGSFTSASAEYVAGYVTKKLNGKEKIYYEEKKIIPEYAVRSVRPPLGDKYLQEIIIPNKRTYCDYKGHKVRLPRLYREKLYKRFPIMKEIAKQKAIDERGLKIDQGYTIIEEIQKSEQINTNYIKKIMLKGGDLR